MAYARHSNNSLSQTTTYSGSDITAIAYRDTESPAIKFIKNQLRKEIQQLEEQMWKESERANEQFVQEAKIIEANNRLDQLSEDAKRQAELSQRLEDFAKTDLMTPEASGYTVNYKQPSLMPDFGISLQQQTEDFMGYMQNERAKSSGEAENRANQVYEQHMAKMEFLRKEQEAKQKELDAFNSSIIVLGSLHTISYSSFREKFAVRSLGGVAAKGYTHGPRTIAGTMIFNVLQSHELYKLADILTPRQKGDQQAASSHPASIMLDQIEPFNLILMFANEFGVYSSLHLFNVTIQSEGQSMSIDQIITQNEMNFYALEMLPMTSLGNAFESTDQMIYEIINESRQRVKEFKGRNYRFKEIAAPKFETITSNIQSQADIEKMLSETRGLF